MGDTTMTDREGLREKAARAEDVADYWRQRAATAANSTDRDNYEQKAAYHELRAAMLRGRVIGLADEDELV